MCKTDEIKKDESLTIVENVDKFKGVRPDLYVNDPIINEKISTFQKCYGKKEHHTPSEHYGRVNFLQRYSLKNLFDEFHRKPIRPIKYNKTLTGLHYRDPSDTFEAKLFQNFCTEPASNEINNSFNEKCNFEFVEPYISSYEYQFKDCILSRMCELVQNDIITCYNNKEKNKISPRCELSEVKIKSFIRVPFSGDSSTYQESYKNPQSYTGICDEILFHPDYFEELKMKKLIK